jgi:hypothetical protein
MLHTRLPSTFCWTKMGTESGEELNAIVTRKEWERQLGQGTFLWGIGQSVGRVAETAAGEMRCLPAIFSPMPSRPKEIDVTPGNVSLWTASVAADGTTTPLPVHVLVTSRATGACQGTCRISHAAKGCLSVACEAIVTTDSRSGLRVTAPIGVQSRVQRDQRAGLRSRAWTYTS